VSIDRGTFVVLDDTFHLDLVKVVWLLATMSEPVEPFNEDVSIGGAKVAAEVGICKEVLKALVVETGVVVSVEECLVVEHRVLQFAQLLLRHDVFVRPEPRLGLRTDICISLGLELFSENGLVD
jgi:hypothetical protein